MEATTQQMTEEAITIRDQMLTEAVAQFGSETVSRWADDPAKVGLFNAMAQIEADEQEGE